MITIRKNAGYCLEHVICLGYREIHRKEVIYNGKTQTVDLIAQNAVDALTDTQKAELDKSSLSGMVKRVAIGVGIAVIVLLLIFCITRFIGYRSYQRRKQLRRQRPRRRRNYRR